MTQTELLIERIMCDLEIDRDEAIDYIDDMEVCLAYLEEDFEEKLGCGDCYGDAL